MTTIRKYKKFIALVVIFAFTLTILPVASLASETSNESYIEIQTDANGNPTEKTINEIKEIIEFVMEEVVYYDSDGNVVGADTSKLIDKYGHSPEMDKLINILNGEYSRNSVTRADFGNCIIGQLLDAFGADVILAIGQGKLIDLIKKKAYKEAAELIAKALVRLGGTPITVAFIVASIIQGVYVCSTNSYSYINKSNHLKTYQTNYILIERYEM